MRADCGCRTLEARQKKKKIEKWWEVNRKHDPPLTRGATPLVERCMRVHSMNENFARRVLKGYRQFMELKSVMNDWQGQKLSPPIPISQMWEQHLIDNLNYTDDCFLLFGRVIGNDPDACLDVKATSDRIKTTKIAFQARYGDDLDPDVWIYHTPEDTERELLINEQVNTYHQLATGGGPRGRLPVAGIAASAAMSMQNGIDRMPPPQQHMTPTQPTPTAANNNDRNSFGDNRSMMHDRGSLSPRGRSLVAASEEEQSSPIKTTSPRQRSGSKNPPKSPTGNDPITIFLRDQSTGEETYFSLRYRSTLRIVFTVFAERKGLSQDSLKFSFNGQSLTGYETPYSLGLEDRARIDVSITGRRN